MTAIKAALLRAMAKDIPLNQVGCRMLDMALMTDAEAAEHLHKAMEQRLGRSVLVNTPQTVQ